MGWHPLMVSGKCVYIYICAYIKGLPYVQEPRLSAKAQEVFHTLRSNTRGLNE